MPPKSRAASRLRSIPPDNKPPSKPKPKTRKRATSVITDGEDEKAPPPRKRGRPTKNVLDTDKATNKDAVTQKPAGDDEKAQPRSRGRPPKSKRLPATREPVKEKEAQNLARGSRTKAINSLQQPSSHPRPSRLCFVFGTGDFGQFGLGTETLGEISRPRLHAWFETAAKGDVLGSEGAGVEKICAGGMHTLAVDEAGKVKALAAHRCSVSLIVFERSGHGVSTITPRWADLPTAYPIRTIQPKPLRLNYLKLSRWLFKRL